MSVFLLLAAACLLRVVFLDMDPHYYQWAGYVTDEGRWTEQARTFAQLGTVEEGGRIHLLLAPLFQALSYVSFEVFGVSLVSARLTSARDAYDLLTVGQLERTGQAAVQYRIEAIFIDGMPIDPNDPDVQREVYQGHLLGIDLSSLMPADATVATFEQQNGSLQFRFQ